jgi:hypothetical protein
MQKIRLIEVFKQHKIDVAVASRRVASDAISGIFANDYKLTGCQTHMAFVSIY